MCRHLHLFTAGRLCHSMQRKALSVIALHMESIQYVRRTKEYITQSHSTMHERCLLAEESERMFTIGPHKGVLHLNHELAVDGTFSVLSSHPRTCVPLYSKRHPNQEHILTCCVPVSMHNAVQASLHMGFLLNLHVDFHVWIKSCCITVTVTFAFEETVVIFKVHSCTLAAMRMRH